MGEDEILNKLGEFTTKYLKREIDTVRPRYTYNGAYIGNYKVNNTGTLKNSIDYRVESNEFTGEFEVIITMEDYGADILFNEGRRPGKFPPPDDIRDWARLKIPNFGGLSMTEQKGLVYVISRAIKRRGIGAVDIFGLVTPQVEKEFEDFYNELIAGEDLSKIPGLEDIQSAFDRIIFLSKSSDLLITEE
jgi:hypothetical protein